MKARYVVNTVIALLGLAVLFGDICGDMAYFELAERRQPALIVAAVLRNSVTLLALVCLFLNRSSAAFALLLAAFVGGVRRVQFMFPILMGADPDNLSVFLSGLDVAFRCLLLGLGIGYFLGRGQKE